MEPAPLARKPHLLVVDDDEQLLTGMKLVFSRDYQVTTSVTGNDVLDILKNETIDLIILDLNLGKRSGEDILVDIKKAYPEQKVIMYTGEDLGRYAQVLLASGATRCIAKDFELLRDTIKEVLES